jgi:flavin reductase (DIM6/NTAB) family NADH-FMN oxidoreductase RutF
MTTCANGVLGDRAVNMAGLRRALGRFTSGVTVVTTASALSADVHGMTANAFTSVSLDPPLVLISVSTDAKCNRRIVESGRYGISILGAEQHALCSHFAGAAQRPDLVKFLWRDGLPLIVAALAHLVCTVRASHPVGDHTLHIGEVDQLWERDGAPLVFYNGQLRALGAAAADVAVGCEQRG